MKYVFVTGGPMSGIGKGIISSSIAMMFGWVDVNVTAIKIDGYLNFDADTMSPFEHGEAYVTHDGGVTDLDLGNYERFVGLELNSDNSITMGKIYAEVARKERAGEYGGKTVQIVPHITDAIKSRIRKVAQTPVLMNDVLPIPKVCIIEIGGTVGDMETQPVFHAIKQMIYENGSDSNDMCFIHVSHLSYVGSSDGDREEKTKPTQHNVELLRSLGISPNIMIMRCEKPLLPETRAKLANHCLIHNVIDSYNVANIHYVPQVLHKQNLMGIISKHLNLNTKTSVPSKQYMDYLEYFGTLTSTIGIMLKKVQTVNLAVVGKYTGMNDTYLSLIRAIQHGAYANYALVNITWVDSEELEEYNIDDKLKNADGILVPGGFGIRGIAGMMLAAKYARKRNIPYFGICLGMQIMVAEYASTVHIGQHVCHNSIEWCNCSKHHAIQMLPDQSMRLGNYSCDIEDNSQAHKIYETELVNERHRHRYEINTAIVGHLEDNGIIFTGTHGVLCEIAEIVGKKFNIGCQFHPEFRSRYWKPHPLFKAFIAACI
jgi:CTP synthase